MGSTEGEEAKKLGNEAFVGKKYDEAIKHYTEALKADPENSTFCAVIYSNRSACHAGNKDWQAAFDDASESLKKDHTFLKAYYRVSVAQCELGQYDDALELLGVASRIDPASDMINKATNSARAKKNAAMRAKRSNKQLDGAQQKEFQELNNQTNGLMRDLQMAKNRQNAMEREVTITRSTSSSIETVADGVPLFRGVGKAFMFQTKEQVLTKLGSIVGSLEKQKVDLVDRQKFLERRINTNSKDLQDMLQ